MNYTRIIRKAMKSYENASDIGARTGYVIGTVDKVSELAHGLTERVIDVVKLSERVNCHGASAYILGLRDAPACIGLIELEKLALQNRLVENSSPHGLCLVFSDYFNHSGIILNPTGEDLDKEVWKRQDVLVLHKNGCDGILGDLKITRLWENGFGSFHPLKFYTKP